MPQKLIGDEIIGFEFPYIIIRTMFAIFKKGAEIPWKGL